MYMNRILSNFSVQAVSTQSAILILILIGGNLIFNIVSNAAFKVSAASSNWRGLLTWQVIGNLAGLVTVITLTWLLKYLPLRVAFPVTTGLAVIGVQLVAAGWIFGESITPLQWLGTILVVIGIALLSGR
jgi:multidrug transporter EmrE-like cation transporter